MTTENAAAGPAADRRPAPLLPLEEFFADPEFAAPAISPDGRRLAYLAPAHGRRNVWVRAREHGHDQAVLVTRDARRGITTHYWAEDSRHVLYLQDTDGNEDWHLFRIDLEAPEEPAVDLTPMDPGSRVAGVDPRPGAPTEVLVWMNRRPLIFDIFRIDVVTGETTLHLEERRPVEVSMLDREGTPRFHMRATEGGGREFRTLGDAPSAAAEDDRRVLATVDAAGHPMDVQPAASTGDGSGLLLGDYQDSDDLRLIRIDAHTGQRSVVAAARGRSLDISGNMLPGVMAPPYYVSRRTGDVIAARFVDDRPHIEIVDPDYADVFDALAAASAGVLATLDSDDTERWWVATFTHDRDPGVSVLYDRETGESRELFRAHPERDPEVFAPMRPVAFPARDGLPLHAFLTLPVGVEPRDLPMVVLVHGGPWYHDSWSFSSEVQFLANRGYAVLQPNFRGSTGYGKRHLEAAVGEFAGAMHDDVVDAVHWATEQGYADPARVGIMGGSYGGYESLVGVTVTPDLFAAAVDYVGVSDLAHFMGSLPPFARENLAANWVRYVGDPEDPAQEADMRARSPITRVDRIRTPLLVAQGANDVRVVRAQSDAIVASLRERGVPVEYLVADDEGHGFENPENQAWLHCAIERHFARHLGGRAE